MYTPAGCHAGLLDCWAVGLVDHRAARMIECQTAGLRPCWAAALRDCNTAALLERNTARLLDGHDVDSHAAILSSCCACRLVSPLGRLGIQLASRPAGQHSSKLGCSTIEQYSRMRCQSVLQSRSLEIFQHRILALQGSTSLAVQ